MAIIHGDQLAPNQIVVVDGKRISADIKELNTEEGWVEFFIPVLNQMNTISKDEVDEKNVPMFDSEVRRVEGEVKIVELQVPTQ